MSSSPTKKQSESEIKILGRPKRADKPGSYKLPNGMFITLENIIRESNGCNQTQLVAKLKTNVTSMKAAFQHFGFDNYTAFRKIHPSSGNAVGPAPGNGAAAVDSAPGNGAAAVDSAPGNGAPRAPSSLSPPQKSDEQTWISSPFDEQEPNEVLAGDEDMSTEDGDMSIDNVHPPTEGEHNVAPLLEPSGSDPLSDNTATTNGYTPWPFANITNLNPTVPLPWDFWRKV